MSFLKRHIGPSREDISSMLKTLKASSLDEFIQGVFPKNLLNKETWNLPSPLSEPDALEKIKKIGNKNKIFKSYIGGGYASCYTPSVILRNILENPAWYTSYTPYQPEIAQGRLEALLNFQTLISSLTGMEIANASLLDEGTAVFEACSLAQQAHPKKAKKLLVDHLIFPQTLKVLKTKMEPLGLEVNVKDFENFEGDETYFASLVQYPNSQGSIPNIEPFIKKTKQKNMLSIVTCDPLSLCLLKSPGEMGADIVVGSSQRLGIPLFFGGPHAAFLATKNKYASLLPGRLVGVSKDRHGKEALRLSLQTREQHIRRERATSNICTSQVLLALMSSFYAVYHGPQGLKKIASDINKLTKILYQILEDFNLPILNKTFFDTIQWQGEVHQIQNVYKTFLNHQINLGRPKENTLSISLDETTKEEDILQIRDILKISQAKTNKVLLKKPALDDGSPRSLSKDESPGSLSKDESPDSLSKATVTNTVPLRENTNSSIPQNYLRTSKFLEEPVFQSYHSETELLRYIYRLQAKELSLSQSMIPLGSCTMKLNATTELLPVTWESFSSIHPLAPRDQAQGYLELIEDLEKHLCELTGFTRFSFQPNSGAQGEYAGLLTIKKYHEKKGESYRNICLIPTSAHGTNPASATLAGLKVIPVQCTKEGTIDHEDLKKKLEEHGKNLSCMMITYPSTYGIFEEGISEICDLIHEEGGLVYLDGANMNALLGLLKPASIGFDVGHLNLHKTFCIPHGGGGPGSGPIGVNKKLKDFLPPSDFSKPSSSNQIGPVSSSAFGSAGILLIPWMYIQLMAYEGLKKSGQIAILNANYIKERLKDHYRILFTGQNERVAHECIIDCRKFKNTVGLTIDDIAKRLIDYGFHAPTMSWPVVGTLMIEPTESESKEEMDRFCEALISIRKEIESIENKTLDKNLLKNAPHTIEDLVKPDWNFKYSKEQAVFPLPWLRKRKFWPSVSRVEQAYGDINLFCSCSSSDLLS